jgi:hypothetical protein
LTCAFGLPPLRARREGGVSAAGPVTQDDNAKVSTIIVDHHLGRGR